MPILTKYTNHVRFCLLILLCQPMNPFLSWTYWERKKSMYSFPLTMGKKTYTYPTNSGKEYISLPSFFPNCPEKKGFCYSNNKKSLPILTKNSGKNMISFGITSSHAPLSSWHYPQK